jgi:hypothetical protein
VPFSTSFGTTNHPSNRIEANRELHQNDKLVRGLG